MQSNRSNITHALEMRKDNASLENTNFLLDLVVHQLEAYAKAATPGPAHKRLDVFVGSWAYTGQMFMDPSKPPTEIKGTCVPAGSPSDVPARPVAATVD